MDNKSGNVFLDREEKWNSALQPPARSVFLKLSQSPGKGDLYFCFPQGQIHARLQTLKDDRDKIQEFREAEMRRNWEYLVNTLERRHGGVGVSRWI